MTSIKSNSISGGGSLQAFETPSEIDGRCCLGNAPTDAVAAVINSSTHQKEFR
jgi:hypothetical protein